MEKRRTPFGLTLIEVLIIVVMVAILMTIVFQKIRGRAMKDVFQALRTDIETVRTAESKYFAGHNAYGTREQLDSASLLTPPISTELKLTATATGYSIVARSAAAAASPLTCTLDVAGGETAAKEAEAICRN